jgi:thioredoxin reductase
MQHRRDFIRETGMALAGVFIPLPKLEGVVNDKKKMKEQYDVIIVGGSYSGMAAAMALGRAVRKVLVIDSGKPCNRQTPHSHNFLTNDGKSPAAIAGIARKELQQYDTVRFLEGLVTTARKSESGFEVVLEHGISFASRKLILATGIQDIFPDIPGFAACWGISVLHCPYCHGYEVRGRQTGVWANGDTGYELAALISNWTNDVTLFTNGASNLDKKQTDKLRRHDIQIVEKKIAQLEHQHGQLHSLVFEDGTMTSLNTLYARLPFVLHSPIPYDLGCGLTKDGYVTIDAAHLTTIPGVYACGDNVTRIRTVANAVSMGTTAGMMVNKALIEEFF